MKSFQLSSEADMDLQEIYDYSFEQWGEDQAEAYIQYLFHVFQLLADRPYMARL